MNASTVIVERKEKHERNIPFDYQTAFSRNLGFVDRQEQETLRRARVAIAGLGGTGGAQVAALVRLGIGNFVLADIDTYEIGNFNRQVGANIHTVGRKKTDVQREAIGSVNPEASLRVVDEGIRHSTVDRFLEGADVVVDSLDFYCFDERLLLYRAARERGLWVITAPPLGFGTTVLAFDPQGMSFEDYFGLHANMSERARVCAFLAGLSPSLHPLRYLVRRDEDVEHRRLPSLGAAPFLIAGLVATEVTRLVLRKGKPIAAPHLVEVDPFVGKFRVRRRTLGLRAPLQRLRRFALERLLFSK